jgi:hypothetical protein
VIVGDLDVVRLAILPVKTNAPSIVDSDRVLAGTISPQRLQPKAWRFEILERANVVEECEPTLRGPLERVFNMVRQA